MNTHRYIYRYIYIYIYIYTYIHTYIHTYTYVASGLGGGRAPELRGRKHSSTRFISVLMTPHPNFDLLSHAYEH